MAQQKTTFFCKAVNFSLFLIFYYTIEAIFCFIFGYKRIKNGTKRQKKCLFYTSNTGTIKTTRITGSLFFGYKPHVPLGAEAPSRKNYQPHYISQQPLLRGCYFLLGSPVNGSTSSFKTICSSTTSSCNCSRIYFFIASLFLPTVST